MLFMNEYDVDECLRHFHPSELPNLSKGSQTLANLVRWTNRNSDGWAYWPKPVRAAKSLMLMLNAARDQFYRGYEPKDVSDAELAKALRPIKAFLTREGVDHGVVF